MTIQEMRDEVIRLTEYDSNEPTNDLALYHLNLALQECSRYTEYLLGIESYTVNANTKIVFDVATKFATVEELWWNGNRLYPYEDGWLITPPTTTGTPTRYILSASAILLIPNPNANGTLTVRGALLHPKAVISNPQAGEVTECLFPPDVHYSICQYAAGNWLGAYTPHQEQTQRAINLKKLAMEKWEQLRQQVLQTAIKTMRYKQ